MKKIFSLLLVMVLALSLCACGGNKVDMDDFPFIGTWSNDEGTAYLRVMENGVLKAESIVTNTSTNTHNGVTTKSESKSTSTLDYSWALDGNKFIFNGSAEFTPTEKDGVFSLVGEKITYVRVGELDYEILLEPASDSKSNKVENSTEYALGTLVTAEGFELVLDETGIKENIRITSKSSGISITSGPSVEEGKKYVYLKGTLKNTSKTAIRPAIAGAIYLDDYEFNLNSDIISTAGSPVSEIDPLDTVNVLLFAKISNEMESAFTNGKIVFGFNDNFSDVMLEEAQYLYHTIVTL